MKTSIVLISVDFTNSRKVCEKIEGQSFDRRKLDDLMVSEMITNYSVIPLSDFMDSVNNQDLDDLTNYFMSYIKIK